MSKKSLDLDYIKMSVKTNIRTGLAIPRPVPPYGITYGLTPPGEPGVYYA